MKKNVLSIIALMFVVSISKAQTIPNASFENWTSHTSYYTPDNWGCINNKTNVNSIYTCQKATPGTDGTNYLKLTSKTVGSNVVNGMAVCGILDSMTMMPKSGFACSGRPANLTGKWQHMIYGSSQGSISITLTRWDATTKKRITVGTGSVTLSGMAMSWASFSIPISYADGTNPDSCIILMAASGTNPTNNDYLWVDNLAFSGAVSGVNQVALEDQVQIFPNPAIDVLNLSILNLKQNKIEMRIMDFTGKEFKKFIIEDASPVNIMSIGELPYGNYILEIQTSKGNIYKSFIKY